MFKPLSEAELAKLTPEQRDQYAKDKAAHDKQIVDDAIAASTKSFQEKLDAIEKKIPTTTDADTLATMNKQIGELKEQIRVMKDFGNSVNQPGAEGFKSLLEKALTEALPTLKKMKAGDEETKGKELELTIKAAVNMTTGSVANASGVVTPDSYVYNQVTQYATDIRANAYIINFMDNGTTDKPSLPYMDKVANQGSMAITAEGALKPLISFTFELRYSTAQKVAGRVKVSEEALDDIPYLMSIINGELRYEHDIAEQAAIFTKINAIAAPFVAGGMAASTDTPTNWDAIRAVIFYLAIVSKGRYRANAILIKSVDLYNMGAAKTTYGQYVQPPFVSPDQSKVCGVPLIEVFDSTVADGTFIVADFKKLHRFVYKSFSIRIGQGIVGDATAANIASDFEKNMYTIIGESRFHLWVYKNEEPAFIKTTFAAVKTAIASA